jgi:hypothetical protein
VPTAGGRGHLGDSCRSTEEPRHRAHTGEGAGVPNRGSEVIDSGYLADGRATAAIPSNGFKPLLGESRGVRRQDHLTYPNRGDPDVERSNGFLNRRSHHDRRPVACGFSFPGLDFGVANGRSCARVQTSVMIDV